MAEHLVLNELGQITLIFSSWLGRKEMCNIATCKKKSSETDGTREQFRLANEKDAVNFTNSAVEYGPHVSNRFLCPICGLLAVVYRRRNKHLESRSCFIRAQNGMLSVSPAWWSFLFSISNEAEDVTATGNPSFKEGIDQIIASRFFQYNGAMQPRNPPSGIANRTG